MQQRHFVRFGTYPHVIINHLARRKLDANRPELEAACGSDAARIALGEWHAFIDSAEAAVVRASGRGWYMDIHGHGHAKQRLEIGYLLTSAQLSLTDAALDANRAFRDTASSRTMAEEASMAFSSLVRGPMRARVLRFLEMSLQTDRELVAPAFEHDCASRGIDHAEMDIEPRTRRKAREASEQCRPTGPGVVGIDGLRRETLP